MEQTKTVDVSLITKGIIKIEPHDEYDKSFRVGPVIIDYDDVDQEEQDNNAMLIAEAFNVANATGLSPVQMAARLKEAERLLLNAPGIRSHTDDGDPVWYEGVCTDMECGCKQSKYIAEARAFLSTK